MTEPADPGLENLIASWQLMLNAAKKRARTLDTYEKNVRAYLAWCTERSVIPVLSRSQVIEFLAWMNDSKMAATTMRARLVALRSFAKWCAKEGELPSNELSDIEPAGLEERFRPILSLEQFGALVATCDVKAFKGKRDAALLHLMRDSGGRSQEILDMALADVSVKDGTALVHGKGGRDRIIPFRTDTAAAVDRYIRARRHHKLAESNVLWLGDRGQNFGYSALWKMVNNKCVEAEISHVHPHMFRRMFADEWLSAGGSTDGLMALAGWRDPQMIKHYAGARANVRALEEHKRLFGK